MLSYTLKENCLKRSCIFSKVYYHKQSWNVILSDTDVSHLTNSYTHRVVVTNSRNLESTMLGWPQVPVRSEALDLNIKL